MSDTQQEKEFAKQNLRCQELVKENERLAQEVTSLRTDRFKFFHQEECWIYDEHFENYLESLVCPVVMRASTLQEIISKNIDLDALAEAILEAGGKSAIEEDYIWDEKDCASFIRSQGHSVGGGE